MITRMSGGWGSFSKAQRLILIPRPRIGESVPLPRRRSAMVSKNPSPELMKMAQELVGLDSAKQRLLAGFGEQIVRECAEIAHEEAASAEKNILLLAILRRYGLEW